MVALPVQYDSFGFADSSKAVALGAVAQFRVMGGAVGLAIVTTSFNGLVRRNLGNLLSSSQIDTLLRYPETIPSLPIDLQETVRTVFADGYTLQMKILAGLAAGQIPAALLMWEKDQIMI